MLSFAGNCFLPFFTLNPTMETDAVQALGHRFNQGLSPFAPAEVRKEIIPEHVRKRFRE
jgi:hypothetical protein